MKMAADPASMVGGYESEVKIVRHHRPVSPISYSYRANVLVKNTRIYERKPGYQPFMGKSRSYVTLRTEQEKGQNDSYSLQHIKARVKANQETVEHAYSPLKNRVARLQSLYQTQIDDSPSRQCPVVKPSGTSVNTSAVVLKKSEHTSKTALTSFA